jgi:inhibitor of cysteine peptidase
MNDKQHVPGAVEVGESGNGTGVDMRVGQELILRLDSNPSTGYHWDVIEGIGAILEQSGESQYHPSGSLEDMSPGGGGVEIFRFQASAAGQTELVLAYRRPWEQGEPNKKYTLEVRVSPDE